MEIWGHRGASFFAAENTLNAFQLAVDMGADGVELDIHLSKDGELVVTHDETIERCSNGYGYVREKTLRELKALNFSGPAANDEHLEIPTLAEVFELLEPTQLKINIEVKSGKVYYPDIEKKAVALVHKYGMEERIVWSSFDYYSMRRVREQWPEAKTALLCSDVWLTAEMCANAGVYAIHPKISQCAYPGLVKDFSRHGIVINPWNADSAKDIAFASLIGAGAVITNRIDTALHVREKFAPDA